MKKIFFYPFAIAMLMASQSCSSDAPATTEPEPGIPNAPEWNTQETPFTQIPLPTKSQDMVADVNAFALNLLKERGALSNATENVAISPFSVYSTLAMLANGDSGDARAQILDALGMNAKNGIDNLNQFCHTMMQWLPKVDGQSPCCPANSIWVNNNFEVNKSYASLLDEVFDANIEALDLSQKESIDRINKWCENKTYGMMPEFFDYTMNGSSALAIIMNAIYFKGAWQYPFLPEVSENGTFKSADGVSSNATFMRSRRLTQYSSYESWQMAALPYGNGNFRMLLLLPSQESQPKGLDNISIVEFNALKKALETTPIDLSLPRFSAEIKSNIAPELNALGITEIFNGKGLSGICGDKNLNISEVIHGTKISVDEKGTEAASITAAKILSTNLNEEELQYLSLTFDRPFIYFIEEASSGTILFAGHVKHTEQQD